MLVWSRPHAGGVILVALIFASLPWLARSKCDNECENVDVGSAADAGAGSKRSLLQAVVMTGTQNETDDNGTSGASLVPFPMDSFIAGEVLSQVSSVPLAVAGLLHEGGHLPPRSGHPESEVLVEERAHGAQPPFPVPAGEDVDVPVIRHVRTDNEDVFGSLRSWLLPDEGIAARIALLLLLLVLLCLSGFCCLRFHHPNAERMALKPNPRLTQSAPPEAHPGPAPSPEAVPVPLHVHYKKGAERIFTVRGLQAAALESYTRTENNIVDAAGNLVLKSFVTVPQHVDWYQQWYWHWQRVGLADVSRATPLGRLMGYQVKEHPVISLHSPAPLWKDVRSVGPVFASCRGAPPAQADTTAVENDCMYFYDADDHLFASMARIEYLGTSKYCVSASGVRLSFSGHFSVHEITVMDGGGEQVAVAQHCTKEQDPSGQCYNIHIPPAVDWATVVLVLIALQAIEVEEHVAMTTARPAPLARNPGYKDVRPSPGVASSSSTSKT